MWMYEGVGSDVLLASARLSFVRCARWAVEVMRGRGDEGQV